ncbi:ferredoxin-type protein NapF [Psychromonas sp. MME2]|uniref:ferredoxin-type protein NapF n=1 Tax=unclassified Psychromonas TaxID=2614957 RepID=UPI00339D1152
MLFNASKRRLFKHTNNTVIDNLLPWIYQSEALIAHCTQCGDCIDACPEKIVIKGDGGYPSIDFSRGECTFCGKCADICKAPIFVSTELQPWSKKAQVNNSCLANLHVYCRSCADSCEVEALSFQLGVSNAPLINADLCTGCGACFSPCPTQAIDIKEIE